MIHKFNSDKIQEGSLEPHHTMHRRLVMQECRSCPVSRPQGVAHLDTGHHTEARGHLGTNNHKSREVGSESQNTSALGSTCMETRDGVRGPESIPGPVCPCCVM